MDIINKDAIRKLQQELSELEAWRYDEIKPVKSQNLHFTVIFLNEVDPSTIGKIKHQLSEISFQPINITYRGLGGFPESNFANVIWVGIDDDGKSKITSLADSVISKMKDIGFRPDKPFTPHMTIFRAKKGKLRLKEIFSTYSTKSFGDDIIERVALKSSSLTPYGPIYSDVFVVHAN